MKQGNMYSAVIPWNVYKGCLYDCIYCKVSFQRQAKRQLHNCRACYDFTPHAHPERIAKMPKGDIIWPGSSGDISFCDPDYLVAIIFEMSKHPERTFYLQSKNPAFFNTILYYLRDMGNVILLTTLETNRDEGYDKISKAPVPSVRARDFAALDWPRKIVTIEPILEFDFHDFFEMIFMCKPELVYIGYNSKPKSVKLPEPELDKTVKLTHCLQLNGIRVIKKTMREKIIKINMAR
jgi:hypothetical protein